MNQIPEAALAVAISQVGQTEKPLGSNWGHPVQDYLLSVGINFPASWCMAFIYWCFLKASEEAGEATPLLKTGGVLHAWETADEARKIEDHPQAGDIFIMDLGKGLGHTGIVVSVSADGHVLQTVEGNTNDTGSREGIEVARKQRFNQRPIIGYLRY